MHRLFAPTVWLSARLSFSRKYMLIGVVVMLALAFLSVPLLRQAQSDSRLAANEREGLKSFELQAEALYALVQLRGASMQTADSLRLGPLTHSMAQLTQAAQKSGNAELANRMTKSWAQVQLLGAEDDPQRRFAALTGAINTLLGLIRESGRSYRLNVDPELDAAFDMLTNRLPLVLETIAKQQDALALNTGEMASYAFGAQLVLTESVPGLKAGVAQLQRSKAYAPALQEKLGSLLEGIAKQQDAADKVVDDPRAIEELRPLALANLQTAKALLHEAATAADALLLERIDELHRTQWLIAAILAGVTLAMAYLFAGIYLSTLRSLKILADGTKAFCGGQLSTRITLESQDELVLVANDFNTIATEFGHLLDVIREQNESRQRELETLVQARTSELAEKNEQLSAVGARVQEEINLARNVQLAILPQSFPCEPSWSVHACMYPARELGGDFYDCFALSGGRTGVLVADVSGKGVGAAFFMAVSRTVLLDLALSERSPAAVLARANDLLCERNPMELFVTACYAIFNPQDGSLVYASAGHHPPLLRSYTGEVQALPCTHDIALGIVGDMQYRDHNASLAAGDALLLYTDGVTEAFSTQGEAYGDERLLAWMRGIDPNEDARKLVSSLVDDVAHFVNGAEASDDLTCLVLCRKQGETSLENPPIELHNKVLLLNYEMPSRLEEIAKLAQAIEDVLPERPDLAFSANLCLEELITNTIQHGLGGVPDRSIHIRLSITTEWLEIIMKDDAPPFDPFAEAPAPDLGLGVDARPVGGLGVHLVKTMMDDARAYYDGSGNLIVLLKTLRK